jgi:hypothetical protein
MNGIFFGGDFVGEGGEEGDIEILSNLLSLKIHLKLKN